jgi:Mn2+/Fe2+ NRAMP family transporter
VRAKAFYVTIAVIILLGYGINYIGAISPIKALVYSAAINGIIAPPLIIVLLLICNNPKIVGTRMNGKLSNILGWAAVALMGAAAIYMIYSWITGSGDSG